jgi:2-polyprenyl-3-methyl-5-hydroxy-6-metoxy-1,4-benzoquinol methylase
MNCYLCKAPLRILFNKNNYEVYHCDQCELEQTDLKQSYDEFLVKQYSKEYFTGDESKNAYTDYKNSKPLIVKNMQKYLTEIKKIKPEGKLLDIGCALGFFVEMANKAGFDSYGIDPSEYAIDEAKLTLGNKVQKGTLNTVDFKEETFDVITMLDVFEHLNDPEKELHSIYRLLKKDGLLLIATGDTGSLLPKIMGRKWTFYNPPQHLFFFNQKNIGQMLDQAHFKPVKWFRIGKWLNLKYILHLAKTTGESKVGKALYGLIQNNSLGNIPMYLDVKDNMILIARKN